MLLKGPRRTVKLASNALARELALDLRRLDLGPVVSKYIGDTEENLNQTFEAAEKAHAILVFDDADALFGNRVEVPLSPDIHTHIRMHLLERVQARAGITILCAGATAELDPAFTRRLRFIVEFPFPGTNERAKLWEDIAPESGPAENDVDNHFH